MSPKFAQRYQLKIQTTYSVMLSLKHSRVTNNLFLFLVSTDEGTWTLKNTLLAQNKEILKSMVQKCHPNKMLQIDQDVQHQSAIKDLSN